MTEEFFDKLDELSIELKKLSDRDKSNHFKKDTNIDKKQIVRDALDKIENVDKTIYIIDGLIKEKTSLKHKNIKTQIELDSLMCYKNELQRSRSEWLSVAESNLQTANSTKGKTKIV